MFKNAASLWQPDRWKAVVASAANLAMNILFIHLFSDEFKLDGVILATLLSDVLIQMPWESYAVFSGFFGRAEAKRYWMAQLGYATLALVIALFAWNTVFWVPWEGVKGFLVKGVVAAMVSCALLLALFRDDVFELLQVLKGKRISWNEEAFVFHCHTVLQCGGIH